MSDMMGEISSVSREQEGGITQINQAVTEMDTVTQQNAALVEEAAGVATPQLAPALANAKPAATQAWESD